MATEELLRQREFEKGKNKTRIEQGESAAASKIKSAGTEMVGQASQQLTSSLLKNSWLYLIPSFSLTLFYIIFHFVAHYIGGYKKAFCKFGDEWLPKTGKLSGNDEGGLPMGGAGGMAEYPEIGVFLACCLLELFIILVIFTFLGSAGYVFTEKWEAVKTFFGDFAQILRDIIKPGNK